MAIPTIMVPPLPMERSEEVATKVMKRVQVSKMTRTLQDRLALATIKCQNGWQNLSLDVIEPQVNQHLQQRKRTASSSNNDTLSDTASTTSSHLISSARSGLASSPHTELFGSDTLMHSSGGRRVEGGRIKRLRPSVETTMHYPSSGAITGHRTRSTRQPSWKRTHQLAQSSPIKPPRTRMLSTTHSSQLRPPSSSSFKRIPSIPAPPNFSFTSNAPTIRDEETPSPELSEDDDTDLPLTSFQFNTSAASLGKFGSAALLPPSMPAPVRFTSPPRTPPPQDRRMRKTSNNNNISWSRTPRISHEDVNPDQEPGNFQGQDPVDLLMFLATSPSPAMRTLNTQTMDNLSLHDHAFSSSHHSSFPPAANVTPARNTRSSHHLRSNQQQAGITLGSDERLPAPSTPPPQSTPLPSSHMTPLTSGRGIGSDLFAAPQTPLFGVGGTGGRSTATLNFNDFITMSPSPAQPRYELRTPRLGSAVALGSDELRTPRTGSARRKLNFGDADLNGGVTP